MTIERRCGYDVNILRFVLATPTKRRTHTNTYNVYSAHGAHYILSGCRIGFCWSCSADTAVVVVVYSVFVHFISVNEESITSNTHSQWITGSSDFADKK